MRSPTARRAGIGALVFAVAVGLAACSTAEPTAPEKDTLTVAVATIPANYDPLGETPPALFRNLTVAAVYEPLWNWDETENVYTPWLADEWTVADDGMSMQIRLRDDVYFVDGTHLDAEGLITYWEAFFAEDRANNVRMRAFGPSFEAISEFELRVNFEKKLADVWFEDLALAPIPSPAATADHEAMLGSEPIGSGPYVISEISDVEATYERNPDYWNPDAYPFDTLVLKVFTDNVAALNALKSGQIDATLLDIPNAIEAEATGFTLNRGAGSYATLMVWDHEGTINPAFGDVRVRQAMNMAFDREGILEALNRGLGEVSSQPYTQGQTLYLEGEDDRYSYDLDAARELMADAGYADGFDITIPTFAGNAAVEPIVQQSLGDIGIRVTFEPQADTESYIVASLSGRYPVSMWGNWSYVNSIGFLNLDIPGRGYILSKFDGRIGELVDEIQSDLTVNTREQGQELGELMLEGAYFVPFSKPQILWASVPEVQITVGGIVGVPTLLDFQRSE